MRITDFEIVKTIIVEIEEGPYPNSSSTYRRTGEYQWEIQMGESWESVYGHESELEKTYQDYMKQIKAN